MNYIRKTTNFALLILILISGFDNFANALQEKLPKQYVTTQSNVLCAYLQGKNKSRSWTPAVKVGSKYLAALAATKDKTIPAKIKTKAKKIAKSKACNVLVTATNLKNIPAADQILTSSQLTSVNSISGTAPLLKDVFSFSESTLTTTFWQSGIVSGIRSGTPTEQQCLEYVGHGSDGQSGGIGSCRLAQDIGDSFTALLRGKASSCYFQKLFDPSQLISGGLTLTRGTLPTTGIASLLEVPSGSAHRVIKLTDGTTINFVKVYSDVSNRAAGILYQYDSWACANLNPSLGLSVVGVRSATIAADGATNIQDKFRNLFVQSQFGVTGTLHTNSSGVLEYDTSRNRIVTGTQVASIPYTILFKSDITIDPSNTIYLQSYDQVSSILRKTYGIAHISGTDFGSLRLLEAAIKSKTENGLGAHNTQTAIEFRDSNYASSVSNPLLSSLSAISLDSNPFYATAPSLSIDLSGFTCDVSADYEISMDLTKTSVQSAIIDCVQPGFVGNMCKASGFIEAESNYLEKCP